MLNIPVPNPCADHSCTEMCVLNAGGTADCLCSDGSKVEMNELCPLLEVNWSFHIKKIHITGVVQASVFIFNEK
jgi:hypothetical protein